MGKCILCAMIWSDLAVRAVHAGPRIFADVGEGRLRGRHRHRTTFKISQIRTSSVGHV